MVMSVFCRVVAPVIVAIAVGGVAARLGGGALEAPVRAQGPPADSDEVGFPVTSDVVRQNCGRCHPSDAAGRMTRISYQRTTPEGWQQTIRRMVLLNGLEITPDDAREAVRYLATHHGLAPDEARAGRFQVERRAVDYRYADVATQQTCNRCHSFGRVLNQRRTHEEWELLVAMHRGYYPLADFQAFRRGTPDVGQPPAHDDGLTAVERAVAHLADVFPLHTPAWTDWSVNRAAPRLAGTWALEGRERGRGPIYGEVEIVSDETAPDRFRTTARYVYASEGAEVTRTGQALVYNGFEWRGRSTAAGDELREVLAASRDQQTLTGRWFSGAYDERGVDVTLRRVVEAPRLTGMWPRALPVTSTPVAHTVELFGVNLPQPLNAEAIQLGAGVTVTRVREASSRRAVVEVTVAADAAIGARDLVVAGTTLTEAVVVFDEVHRVEVTPATGLARVGGANFPKQYEQFEARAFHAGPDGAVATDDDLDLGVVDVEWALEEYAVTYDDDDLSFVGAIDGRGRFTPADDGPNPARSGNRNNIGDVWVVATLATAPGGARQQPPLRARAHLVVTVPLYIRRGATGP